MRQEQVPLPGRSRSLWTLHVGFSVAMGVLLVAYGGLNAVLILTSEPSAFVAGFNAAVAAVMTGISVRFFFPVPIVLCSLSAVAFGVALALS
jgi:hypothetical protein